MINRLLFLAFLLLSATISPHSAQAIPPTPVRVLILGNSIVSHGPAPEIGWYDDWGMAASAEDKDFVHVLDRMIASKNGWPNELMYVNIAAFEGDFENYDLDKLQLYRDFDADIIVIRLGDNVRTAMGYEKAFQALIDYVRTSGEQTLICSSSWFSKPDVDEIQAHVCQSENGRFADISFLIRDTSNRADSERDFETPAVGAHPGDKGMAEIAHILFDVLYPSRLYLPVIVS